jgi:hypothetical protein
MTASYTLAELQGLAREYNRLHTPIALKQSKASLHAQLEQRGVFQDDEQERVAKLVEAVAREGAVWALKLEDRRRYEEKREKKRRKRKRSSSESADSDGASARRCGA